MLTSNKSPRYWVHKWLYDSIIIKPMNNTLKGLKYTYSNVYSTEIDISLNTYSKLKNIDV